MDLGKLSKLLLACKEAGVEHLKMDGWEVTVKFLSEKPGESFASESPRKLDGLESVIINAPYPEYGKEDEQEIKESFDDDMLHLTDPAAWEARQMDDTLDKTIATGGDEVEGHYDV